MSETPEIIDLASVVEPHLNGGQLVSYKSHYLTKPGENYGSVMLSITAIVKRTDGVIEELPLVAKLPPITNELYWQIFRPERTCVTENAMYKYLAPALKRLQLEAGVSEAELYDDLPTYYGCRISLDEAATQVDRDAVLLQENLQTSGYKAGNRHKMFDYAHAKLVMEHMAQYHALPIALRLKNARVFDKYVRPYVHRFNMNETMGTDMKNQLRKDTQQEMAFATNNNEKEIERVMQLFEMYDAFLEQPDASDTAFTTIAHCDLWINNLMIQYDENGAPAKLKIVDFQIAQYESLAHDVIFFLFSSVDSDILEEHYDEFLQIYYNAFVRCLESVNVNTDAYTKAAFLSEIKRVAPIELPHVIFMTRVILADNSTMPEDFKDMDISVLTKNLGVAQIIKKISDTLKLAQKFKIFY